MDTGILTNVLKTHAGQFHPVVPFEPGQDRLYPFDFTVANADLTSEMVADTELFASWIEARLQDAGAKYGIGGYAEHRTLYARSDHFGLLSEEPRRLHLGIDIWGPAGTKIMSPLDGLVHSFAFNNNDSDYGATMIVTHNLDGTPFHTLFGHLSLNSLKNLHEGKRIRRGEVIGEMGMRFENGNWPPHLHFQLITDMEGYKGDYPGVCKFSERETWLANCPDPDFVLDMLQYCDPHDADLISG